jgi:very-short-patch-repair endonuclease
VELDSWEYHNDHAAFDTDRERDATALYTGRETYRLTDERLERQPATEAERILAILERRRRELRGAA